MKQVILSPLKHPVSKKMLLPGCIGYTIRALNIGAMTKGDVTIVNPLKSDDTGKMVEALRTLGIVVEEKENAFIVKGDVSDVKEKNYTIDIGLSGRTARSILAFLCVIPGEKIVTCSEPFKKRPVGELVEGLLQLGAKIAYLEKEGYLPVKITSSKLSPGTITINGKNSSQYFSATMMIAPKVGELIINVDGEQSSKPFIDMTIAIMKKFGITVINKNYKQYKISSGQTYQNPKTYFVEPEATSASYFFAIAAITKSTMKILHLSPNSAQGDIRFADILESMGCEVEKNNERNWIAVTGTEQLEGITIDLNDTPDVVPTLAVVSAFAKGKTTITNIEHVRLKETDRIQSPAHELEKMGIKTDVTQDSLTVYGGMPNPTEVETYHDHRMAMAFAVAGCKIEGMKINNPSVVNKSFPDFWKKLKELGIEVAYEK